MPHRKNAQHSEGSAIFLERPNRSGRGEGTKAQRAHAARKRCVDDRDRLCRRAGTLEKIRSPRSGRESECICVGVGG